MIDQKKLMAKISVKRRSLEQMSTENIQGRAQVNRKMEKTKKMNLIIIMDTMTIKETTRLSQVII